MSTARREKKRIESLYVLKALCSFLVVTVHAQLWCKSALTPLLGVATPCFLAITGFLLYSDNREKEMKKALAWARKTFLLSMACNGLYLVFYLLDGTPMEHYTAGTLLINLFTGHLISMHLWYLSAVWQGLLLLYLLRRLAPGLINFAPLLYIIAFLLRSYGSILLPDLTSDTLFILRANALVTALPFLCTGYLVRKHSGWLTSRLRTLSALVAGIILAYAEYSVRSHIGGSSLFFISTWFLVVLLLLSCYHHQDFSLPIIAYIGKEHSANIYYFHVLVLIYANRWWPEQTALQAVLVFLVTIPLSYLFNLTIRGIRRLGGRIKTCQVTGLGV